MGPLTQTPLMICVTGLAYVMMMSFPVVVSEPDWHEARVRVYVDQAGLRDFKRLYTNRGVTLETFVKDYVHDVFEGMNKMYHSMLDKLNITLMVESLTLLDTNVFTGDSRVQIIQEEAVSRLEEWAAKKYDSKKYDMLVLMTGFDIENKAGSYSGTLGFANIGLACTKKGVGAIEIQDKQKDTLVLAHEIGHILGANHDEQEKSCDKSMYEQGNVMSGVVRFDSPNRFFFSECTTKKIYDRLTDIGDMCMLVIGDKNDSVPALQTTADEACQLLNGKGWTMTRTSYANYVDHFCSAFNCQLFENDQLKRSRGVAPDGLICGKSKRCYKKRCVLVTNGDSNVSDTCPWGSQNEAVVRSMFGKHYPCERQGCEGSTGRMCCGHCQQ